MSSALPESANEAKTGESVTDRNVNDSARSTARVDSLEPLQSGYLRQWSSPAAWSSNTGMVVNQNQHTQSSGEAYTAVKMTSAANFPFETSPEGMGYGDFLYRMPGTSLASNIMVKLSAVVEARNYITWQSCYEVTAFHSVVIGGSELCRVD